MPRDAAPNVLLQRWLHSHEEDSASAMVFRPASFPFPPSRGRAGFELKPNQEYVDIGIAAADGPRETAGTWSSDGRSLRLSAPSSAQPSRTLEIVESSADRLVVRK